LRVPYIMEVYSQPTPVVQPRIERGTLTFSA